MQNVYSQAPLTFSSPQTLAFPHTYPLSQAYNANQQIASPHAMPGSNGISGLIRHGPIPADFNTRMQKIQTQTSLHPLQREGPIFSSSFSSGGPTVQQHQPLAPHLPQELEHPYLDYIDPSAVTSNTTSVPISASTSAAEFLFASSPSEDNQSRELIGLELSPVLATITLNDDADSTDGEIEEDYSWIEDPEDPIVDFTLGNDILSGKTLGPLIFEIQCQLQPEQMAEVIEAIKVLSSYNGIL